MYIFSPCHFIWTHHDNFFITYGMTSIHNSSFQLLLLITNPFSYVIFSLQSIICISNKAPYTNKSLILHDIICIHAILVPHANLILLNNIMHPCIHLIIILLIHAFHDISTNPIIYTVTNLKATLKGESVMIRIQNG